MKAYELQDRRVYRGGRSWHAGQVTGLGTRGRDSVPDRRADRLASTVNTASILRRHVRVQGIYAGSRKMFEEMNGAVAQHKLRPWIGKRFGFEETRAPYD